MTEAEPKPNRDEFTGSEMGAFAHLYRGEVYRSTTWRTRLDNTTNWAVVTMGISLSLAFSDPQATPLPLILVGFLVTIFLMLEARRYRYFNVWRARARLMETDVYAPMLRGEGVKLDGKWNTLLADDYDRPAFHISYIRAIGRRLRKNFIWIFIIQFLAYFSKLIIHPTPVTNLQELFNRATIGPIDGKVIVIIAVLLQAGWIILALATWRYEISHRQRRGNLIPIA